LLVRTGAGRGGTGDRRWRWPGAGGKGERVAPEAKGAGEMLEAQPEEPAGRAGRKQLQHPYANPLNNPYNQSRTIVPQFPLPRRPKPADSCALADGTAEFSIFNTNDLLGGLEKIGREQASSISWELCRRNSGRQLPHLKVKLNRV